MINTVLNGDCLELMKDIPDKSIDLVLTDPPYGSTECGWDKLGNREVWFDECRRVIKDTGTIIVTVALPYGYRLLKDNMDIFKYDAVWLKSNKTDFANAKNKLLRQHENIFVFSKGTTANGSNRKMTYNPQGLIKIDKQKIQKLNNGKIGIRANYEGNEYTQEFTNYPSTILQFNRNVVTKHSTEKPIMLFQYLVRTYSNAGDTVLDCFAGSGTTGVACLNSNRNYILIEKEREYVDIINARLAKNDNTP